MFEDEQPEAFVDEVSERTTLLLKDIGKNRDELTDSLNTIKEFRARIDELLPEKIDYRHKYILEERVKTIVEIIKAELSIRKQMDDSIKLELDLMRKNVDTNKSSGEMAQAIAKALDRKEMLEFLNDVDDVSPDTEEDEEPGDDYE